MTQFTAKNLTPEQLAAAQAAYDAGNRSYGAVAKAAGISHKAAKAMFERAGIRSEAPQALPDLSEWEPTAEQLEVMYWIERKQKHIDALHAARFMDKTFEAAAQKHRETIAAVAREYKLPPGYDSIELPPQEWGKCKPEELYRVAPPVGDDEPVNVAPVQSIEDWAAQERARVEAGRE